MPFTDPAELRRLQSVVPAEVAGAARLAAERAIHVFDALPIGWAAHITPTVEGIELQYLDYYTRLSETSTYLESGFINARRASDCGGHVSVSFGLALASVDTYDGNEFHSCARYPCEGGLGYVNVEDPEEGNADGA